MTAYNLQTEDDKVPIMEKLWADKQMTMQISTHEITIPKTVIFYYGG